MDQDFHLIEKYFRGELSEEELQLFNQKLQKDAAFEQDFRDMKLVREGVKETARSRALDILQNTEARLSQKETTKINVSMRRLVSIAASLLIIATVSYFAISDRTGGSMTGDEVFTTYYKTYPNIVSGQERGSTIELKTLNARAYNAYDIEDYSTSANLFNSLLKAEKNAANYLYSGIANLEAGNLNVAKSNLNTVMNNYTELREQAQWYLAMTLFKEGSEDEALANIAVLSNKNTHSNFTKDAKSLLTRLSVTLSLEEEGGHVINEDLRPPDVEGSTPDGSSTLGLRRYHEGEIQAFSDNKVYYFFNESPIIGLKEGDTVSFILIKPKRSKSKPFAIITKAN